MAEIEAKGREPAGHEAEEMRFSLEVYSLRPEALIRNTGRGSTPRAGHIPKPVHHIELSVTLSPRALKYLTRCICTPASRLLFWR